MKPLFYLMAACLLMGATPSLAASPKPTAQPTKPATAAEQLDAMTWMAGHWGNDWFEVMYSSPKGGVLVGASKEYDKSRAIWFELEHFAVLDGVVTVTPYPGGVKSVPFKLVGQELPLKKAVFQNPEHDFPSEISYERVSPEALRIQIAGIVKGQRREVVYDLRKLP